MKNVAIARRAKRTRFCVCPPLGMLLCSLLFASISLGCSTRPSRASDPLREVLAILGTSSDSGAAVLIQAAECWSRQADLRVIREVIAPSTLGLLDTGGKPPGTDLVQFAGSLLDIADSAVVALPAATTRSLYGIGMRTTPVVIVWNRKESIFLAFSVSADRRVLRRQLIAARELLVRE